MSERWLYTMVAIGFALGFCGTLFGFIELFERFRLEDRIKRIEEHLLEKFGEAP